MGVSYDGALFAKYKNNCELFIETGTYIGDGVQSAINAGFEKIISIELAECQYNYCVNRFKGNDKVSIILGDTRQIITKVITDNLGDYKSIFFWLDAHCSGGPTAGESIDITLPTELTLVIEHSLANNISAILVMDDITPQVEERIYNITKKYPIEFLGLEPCINPFTDRTETDRSILLMKLNNK